jgi:hypothetical protein
MLLLGNVFLPTTKDTQKGHQGGVRFLPLPADLQQGSHAIGTLSGGKSGMRKLGVDFLSPLTACARHYRGHHATAARQTAKTRTGGLE